MDSSEVVSALQAFWGVVKPCLVEIFIALVVLTLVVIQKVWPGELTGWFARRRDRQSNLRRLDKLSDGQRKIMRRFVEESSDTIEVNIGNPAVQELIKLGVLQKLTVARSPLSFTVTVRNDYLPAFDEWAKSQR